MSLENSATRVQTPGWHHESILRTYLMNYGWSSPTAEGILQKWKRENPRNGFLKWWVAKCSQFQLVSPLLDTYHRITPRKDQISVMCHPVVILWKETVVNIEYYFQFDSQGYLRIRCCIQKSTQGWHLIPFSLIFLFVPPSLSRARDVIGNDSGRNGNPPLQRNLPMSFSPWNFHMFGIYFLTIHRYREHADDFCLSMGLWRSN